MATLTDEQKKKIVNLEGLAEFHDNLVDEINPTKLTQAIQDLENKYKVFFDNINVSGSSLIIGSSTVATITGTTLHINQKTV